MARWKELFKPWILARGQEYFECGQVVELKEIGSRILAQVSGTQLYQVAIERSGANVLQMNCDCSYADGGGNCKHMASVLFALEETQRETRMDWQVALDNLSEEQLRNLLRTLAEGDGSLQDRIVRMVSGPGDDPAQWRDELEAYPSGAEEARKLAAYWHIYHKNRPAMKDELQKAGFPPE